MSVCGSLCCVCSRQDEDRIQTAKMGARFGVVTAVYAEDSILLGCLVFRFVNSYNRFEVSLESIGLPVPPGFFETSVTIYQVDSA